MSGKSALLFGASGLVGGCLLEFLLEAPEYNEVVVMVRRELDRVHPKLQQVVADFSDLASYSDWFAVSDIFCCLGTTSAKTRDQDEYMKIDVHYPLEIARLGMEKQVQKYLIITAMGANPGSKVFYNRIKGLLEKDLMALGLPALYIFRPSLLVGKRTEFRFGEQAAVILSRLLFFIFMGPWKKYRPIAAQTVARGMYLAAQRNEPGTHIYHSDQISAMASRD